jgi:uncharacterized membrane protein YhfC
VGLAYLAAVYAVRKRGFGRTEAVPYGLSLAFWENGILLGLLSLFNLGVVYLIIASGSSAAPTVYAAALATQPYLFEPVSRALPAVALGTLERLSSTLAHLAWGVLVVLSATTRRKSYLAMALPMGLVDALVPFASGNLVLFEAVFLLLAVGFMGLAWHALVRAEESRGQGFPTPLGVKTSN